MIWVSYEKTATFVTIAVAALVIGMTTIEQYNQPMRLATIVAIHHTDRAVLNRNQTPI
jgi:hypothetical protein